MGGIVNAGTHGLRLEVAAALNVVDSLVESIGCHVEGRCVVADIEFGSSLGVDPCAHYVSNLENVSGRGDGRIT